MTRRTRFPAPIGTHDRFTGLLAVAAMGVYLLVMLGATTAITGAAAACSTWPACGGRWIVPLSEFDLAIAWGHRVAALAVGIVTVVAALVAWLGDASRRVRLALTVAAALYPVQVALGAVAATAPGSTLVTAVHLLFGMAIFAALIGALAWTLERETATESDRQPVTVDAESDGTPTDGPPSPDLPENTVERWLVVGRAYLRMTKPRLMWLLCLVAAASMALAAGPGLSAATVVKTLGGGILAIGASGTFNQVLERDVDREMNRTSDRPLATDVVSVRNAVAFGCVLTAASLVAFLSVNVLAAALGLCAILFYSVIYTLVLKPNTVQNTVIGGAAGALPALIGSAAVTGRIGTVGLALAAVIFLWTPAHFYNLALAYKEDYARGDFPMLPVVRGEATTRKHVLYYFTATLLATAVLSTVAGLGLLSALTSVFLGGLFLWAIVRLHRERTEGAALRAFHASNAYLGALLVAIVVDALAV